MLLLRLDGLCVLRCLDRLEVLAEQLDGAVALLLGDLELHRAR